MSGKQEKKTQIFPDPRVQVTEWDLDGYPAAIMVTMGDRTKKEYLRRIDQPHPCFEAAMKNIERMAEKR